MASLKILFQFILKGLWLGFLHNFIILFIIGVLSGYFLYGWFIFWIYTIPLGLIIGIINGFVLGILTIAWTGDVVYFYKNVMIAVASITTLFIMFILVPLVLPYPTLTVSPTLYLLTYIIIPTIGGYMGYQMCMWHVHQPTSQFDLSAQVNP